MRLTIWVAGRVQGVGFRYWARSRATDLGLCGSAVNLGDGRVEIVVEGAREACQQLLDVVASDDAPGFVGRVVHEWSESTGLAGFRVGGTG